MNGGGDGTPWDLVRWESGELIDSELTLVFFFKKNSALTRNFQGESAFRLRGVFATSPHL